MSLDLPREEPTTIQTQFGAIFVSLELSRSTWLITSCGSRNSRIIYAARLVFCVMPAVAC